MQHFASKTRSLFSVLFPVLLALVFSKAAFAATTVQTDGNPVWAGYHISLSNDASQLSSITMSWRVPTLDCAKDGTIGIWDGLGGVQKGSILIQTGTASVCSNGNSSDYAWYEFAPIIQPYHLSNDGNYPVYAGDSMGSSVTYNGNGHFVLNLFDDTQGWNYTKQWDSSDSNAVPLNADCELEDFNHATLPQFTTVNVTNCSWEQGNPSVNSQAQPISAGSNLTKDVVEKDYQLFSVQKTSVSPLGSDGMSFSIGWLKN